MLKLLLFSSLALATKPEVEIIMAMLGKAITIRAESGICNSKGVAMSVEIDVSEKQYRVLCNNRSQSAVIPVQRIDNFQNPGSMLNDQKATKDADPEIKTREHAWGTEHRWATRAKAASVYNYLCPKAQKYCFRVVHGGSDRFTFEMKNP